MAVTLQQLAKWWNESNYLRAFAWAVRYGEGTQGPDGYRTMFGGGKFHGRYDQAPWVHPNKPITKNGYTSTAAGAYQFLFKTWDGLDKEYGLGGDFNPCNQDLMFVALCQRRGAIPAIIAGDIDQAITLCNREWASLPGSPYGQPTVTREQFMAQFNDELRRGPGTVRPDMLTLIPPVVFEPAPIVASEPVIVNPPPVAPLDTYTTMPDPVAPTPSPAQQTVANAVTAAVTLANPIAGMLLQVARSLWPEVKPLFTSSGSEVAVRNVKAAEAVVGAIMQATGSPTPAAAMDAITTDPVSANAARAATVTTLQGFGVVDTAGVPDARKFAIEMASNPNALRTPQFILSMYALTIVAGILGSVLFADAGGLSGETKAAILFGSLTPLLGGLAFWFGTSSTSQRKDEIIASTGR